MEENNYRDEFELFLKESADEFKMIPSRKVWYSLYNNLHPDKKWPSMAVCLFILTAILYIGIANNNSLSNAAKKASSENFNNLQNEKNKDNNFTFLAKDYSTLKKANPSTFSLGSTQKNSLSMETTEDEFIFTDNSFATIPNEGSVITAVESEIQLNNEATKISVRKEITGLQKNEIPNQLNAAISSGSTPTTVFVNENEQKNEALDQITGTENLSKLLNAKEPFTQLNDINTVDKSWLEDFAFRNKPAINKLKQNGSLSYYITPSLGYRILSKVKKNKFYNASLAAARTNIDETEFLNSAALNLEAGAIFQYTISKKLRLKVGVQGNYTNYVSSVTVLGHPLQTSITLNNNSNHIRSSKFSANAGKDKINKTTVQVALPLGADFKIAGNKKIGWYAGGSLQPTYVVGGSAYVLSSDEKYYISENNLLRKFNLNTAIETFISLKSSNGIVLNVGPQFRYQLLSTYKKAYGYTENLYNVGIKIGVTTSF